MIFHPASGHNAIGVVHAVAEPVAGICSGKGNGAGHVGEEVSHSVILRAWLESLDLRSMGTIDVWTQPKQTASKHHLHLRLTYSPDVGPS